MCTKSLETNPRTQWQRLLLKATPRWDWGACLSRNLDDEEQDAAKLEGTAFQVEETAGIKATGNKMEKRQQVTEARMSPGQQRQLDRPAARASSARPHAVLRVLRAQWDRERWQHRGHPEGLPCVRRWTRMNTQIQGFPLSICSRAVPCTEVGLAGGDQHAHRGLLGAVSFSFWIHS